MKLNAHKFALAAGVLWAVCMFLLTWIAMATGYAEGFLNLVSSVYPWYSVSIGGSILGFIWGFIDGYVGCWLFAALYNKLLKD